MTRRPAVPVPRRVAADPRAREPVLRAPVPAQERSAPATEAPAALPASARDPAPASAPAASPAPRAPRRRLPRARAVLVLLAGALAAAGLWWVLFETPATALREVTVTGTVRTDAAAVEAAADDQLGRPLLRVDGDAVRARAVELPFVADVEVHRRWLHGVELEVTERVAVAAVAADGGYDVLDGAGEVITTTPQLLDGVPLVDVDVEASGPQAVRAAGEVARALPAELRAEVARVSALSVEDVRLELRDGATVRWGGAESSGLKADVLLVLLQTRARAYDVSAPTVPATSGERNPTESSYSE